MTFKQFQAIKLMSSWLWLQIGKLYSIDYQISAKIQLFWLINNLNNVIYGNGLKLEKVLANSVDRAQLDLLS